MAISSDDKGNYETLKELVFDDNKIVTYKSLSLLLGIHVNAAKQLLFTFYKREKEQGKKIHAVMYSSALRGPRECATPESNGSSAEAIERHVVSLCSHEDLPKIKEGYRQLFSVHIYAVSSFPVTDFSILQQKNTVLSISEGDFAASHGPYRVYKAIAPVAPVKIEPVQATNFQKNIEHKNVNGASSKGVPDKKTGLMAAFATQAQRQTAAVVKIEKKSPNVEKQNGKPKSGRVASVKNSSNKRGKKRSRIIMESDSESDEDAQPAQKRHVFDSDDDEPPQHSRVIVSDDEEEVQEKEKTEIKPKVEDLGVEPAKAGKRKIAKTITKTHVDDEGYTVTVKEQVMVTDDEEDIVRLPVEASSKSPLKSKAEPSMPNSSEKPSCVTSKNSKDIVAKKKQPSIMSFFGKKS